MPLRRMAVLHRPARTMSLQTLKAMLFIAILLALAGGSACGETSGDTQHDKLRVLTSIALFSDFVRQVGGDRVEVEALVPGMADPHTFQPSPRDVRKIQQAQIIVLNGTGFERVLQDTIERNRSRQTPILVLSEGLRAIQTESEEEPSVRVDNPHFWLNPRYAIVYVERIRDGLSTLDPQGAEIYAQNAAHYREQLMDLDREIEAAIATIPRERRKLVTFHDAFPYLAERYGLEIVAVVIRSPGREASAQEVAELSRELRRHNIPTVYKEPQFNARILELAAKDAGVQVRMLYSDALSPEVNSYSALMRYNAQQLVEGLR